MHSKQCEGIGMNRNQTTIKRYSELKLLNTFEERFEYLRLPGAVGQDTFGHDRIFNQLFYASPDWKQIRKQVIARDMGYDLGCQDHPIMGLIVIHHMNPIDMDDIREATEFLLNPEYLITVSTETHKAIHYGTLDTLGFQIAERTPNDTCPWKK